MYQLGGLSFSLGSEIAPGSSGDDSCPIHHLLRECEQWGMKGVGEGLLMLCHYGKPNLKDHKRKNISCSVLLRASLWTEEILCFTGLLMPVYVHPKKWSWDCLVSPEEGCGETTSLDTWRIWNSNWELIAGGHSLQKLMWVSAGTFTFQRNHAALCSTMLKKALKADAGLWSCT